MSARNAVEIIAAVFGVPANMLRSPGQARSLPVVQPVRVCRLCGTKTQAAISPRGSNRFVCEVCALDLPVELLTGDELDEF